MQTNRRKVITSIWVVVVLFLSYLLFTAGEILLTYLAATLIIYSLVVLINIFSEKMGIYEDMLRLVILGLFTTYSFTIMDNGFILLLALLFTAYTLHSIIQFFKEYVTIVEG